MEEQPVDNEDNEIAEKYNLPPLTAETVTAIEDDFAGKMIKAMRGPYGHAIGVPQSPKESDNVRLILELLEVEFTEDNYAIMSMFVRAYQIYIERSKVHGTAWKRRGALNNLVRAATKLERVEEVYWYPDNVPFDNIDLDLDDAFDALNYVAFFITQAERGEWKRG